MTSQLKELSGRAPFASWVAPAVAPVLRGLFVSRAALTVGAVLVLVAAVMAALIAAPPEAFAMKSRESSQMSASLAATLDALKLPFDARISRLQDQGEKGVANLVKIMNDPQRPMDLRWRAVTALGRVAGSNSLPDLRRAIQSKEWFMRNASLIAIAKIDREAALTEARRLLSDPALVVRSAAVDVIDDFRDLTSANLLWEKLNSKENYKAGQSLFIRRRMVETLAKLETPGREGRFIELLADKDEALHAPAVAALERITNRKLGTERQTLLEKRSQWQEWWNKTKRL